MVLVIHRSLIIEHLQEKTASRRRGACKMRSMDRILVLLTVLFAVVHGLSIHPTPSSSGCSIAINGGLPSPQPLLVKPGESAAGGYGFHLPVDSSGVIRVPHDAVIHIACSGSHNYFAALDKEVQEADAICVTGNQFSVSNKTYSFSELKCRRNVFHTARATGETCNAGRGQMIEIGFIVGPEFFRTLEVCFDESLKSTFWSKFELVAGIGGHQSKFPRPPFIADNFFHGIGINKIYTRKVQRTTFERILNTTSLGRRYVSETDDFFIGRGHLAAKSDFVFGSQHSATFHYVNVAPQWQTFNGGNWNRLEQDLRSFAASRLVDLVVYTGTHGVTTLPDENGVEQELWLYVDENGNKAVPVPMVYWKVAYDPKTERAVALVGVNNPYIEKPGKGYCFCKDVCDQVSWVKWDRNDVKKGYAYCCEVNEEFRAVVGSLPNFKVTGILNGDKRVIEN